jgi:hypothetical protein
MSFINADLRIWSVARVIDRASLPGFLAKLFLAAQEVFVIRFGFASNGSLRSKSTPCDGQVVEEVKYVV